MQAKQAYHKTRSLSSTGAANIRRGTQRTYEDLTFYKYNGII